MRKHILVVLLCITHSVWCHDRAAMLRNRTRTIPHTYLAAHPGPPAAVPVAGAEPLQAEGMQLPCCEVTWQLLACCVVYHLAQLVTYPLLALVSDRPDRA